MSSHPIDREQLLRLWEQKKREVKQAKAQGMLRPPADTVAVKPMRSLAEIAEALQAKMEQSVKQREEERLERVALHPDIACHTCSDTGLAPFAGSDVPCRCEKGRAIEREREARRAERWIAGIDRACGIPTKYHDWAESRVDGSARCHLDAVSASTQRHQSTYCYGPVGRGKSAIAAMVLREFVARHGQAQQYALSPSHYGQFCTVGTLLESLKAHYRQPDTVEYKLGLYQSVPLLVLDDLGGPANIRDWAGETLFEVINHRYNAEIPTIYTSNLTLDQLEHTLNRKQHLLGTRIVDRIHETAEVIEVKGPNFRRR